MERHIIQQMIKEAVENLNGIISYTDIRNYINNKWDNVTINDQILMETMLQYTLMDFSSNEDVSNDSQELNQST